MRRKVLKAHIEKAGDVRLWRLKLSCGHTGARVAKGRLARRRPKWSHCGACEQAWEDRMYMEAIGEMMRRNSSA